MVVTRSGARQSTTLERCEARLNFLDPVNNMPPSERPIYCDIVRDNPTEAVTVKICLMCQENKCLYAGTILEGKIKHGQPHVRVSLSAPHETRNRGDSFLHISCVPPICIGPHLPRAANRVAYFEDAERCELFQTFPGMELLSDDAERKAVTQYWSAVIEANLEEKVDSPADRLRFARYPIVKRIDGVEDVNDIELSAALEAHHDDVGDEEVNMNV
jgi:hypothetical protein